jgi:hypothetical protein
MYGMKAIAIGVLLPLLILIGIGFFACSSNSFSGSEYKILSEHPSPKEIYIATLWQGMGGGAGWCEQRISINSKGRGFNLEDEKEHGGYIFEVSCKSKVSVEWKSDYEIHVSYTIEDGVSAYQNPLSDDKHVKIIYEIKN